MAVVSSPDLAICIYPISGTYSSLSRFIYYASLILSFTFRHNRRIARSVFAPAMLYASVAVIHIFVLLLSSGRNPPVLDMDIIATTTLLVSTFWFSATLMQSGAAYNSRARPFLIPWSIGLWFGCAGCCLLTWKMMAEPASVNFFEPLCRGVETTTDGITSVLLSTSEQTDIRKYNFSCTYSCFNSSSLIRESSEILAIEHADLYTTSLANLTRLALGATIVMPVLGLLALIRIYERLYLRRRSRRMGRIRFLAFSFCFVPGFLTIFLGETVILRRDGTFNGESYKSVGQWSSILVVVLVLFGCWVGHHFDVLPEERPILLEPWTQEWEDMKRREEGERIKMVIKSKREREEAERLGKRLPNGNVPPLRPRRDIPGMLEWARVDSVLDRFSFYVSRRRDTFYMPQE